MEKKNNFLNNEIDLIPQDQPEPSIEQSNELIKAQDSSVLKNTPESVNQFVGKFAIAISGESLEELSNIPEERRNQEIMFKIRELFLQSESGKKYAWIPQALECGLRSLNLGTVRAIEIDPNEGIVNIITTGGLIQETLEKISDYSIELLLDEVEKSKELPVFNYSEEMQEALGKLESSARYRWELIARAGYHESLGNNKTKRGQFNVRPVVSDMLTLSREGLGVFSDNVRDFALAKLTYEEVPVTPYEAKVLWQADRIFSPEQSSVLLKEFYGLIFDLTHELENITKKQSKIDKFIDRISGIFGRESALAIKSEIDAIIDDYFTHQHNCMGIKGELKDEVYKAKGTFSEENSFELVSLPQDLGDKFKKAVEYYANLFAKLNDLVENKKSVLLELLKDASHDGQKQSELGAKLLQRAINRLELHVPENSQLKLID
jgi:hypothetical protein